MAPLVQGSNRIVSRTTQPWALPVTIRRNSAVAATLYILGGATLPSVHPQTFALADAGVADGEPDVVSHHDWKPSSFPWPFWLVKRCETKSDANCHISQCRARTVSTMAADFAYTDSSEVQVPIMTNFEAIEKNQELVVHWAAATSKVASKLKVSTWYDHSQKELSKRRKT